MAAYGKDFVILACVFRQNTAVRRTDGQTDRHLDDG